jgi:thiol-disulfide isomerase/thioredoxin
MTVAALLLAVLTPLTGFTQTDGATAPSALGPDGRMVDEVYPGLVSGALTYATLADLSEGRILQSGSLVISQSDMEAALSEVPKNAQEEMTENLFFLLEQKTTRDLLLQSAREQSGNAADTPKDQDVLIRGYLEKAVGDIQVKDAEVAEFYEENKDMCGGASLDQIKGELKQYVLQQKRQEAVTDHIRTLGQRRPIAVSAAWTKRQAVLAMDNAVDKARRSGRPSLVDFGADGCRPCDMMAPILKDLRDKYAGKMNVEFIHVREKQVLAARYGIQSIPVQILFDKTGKEVWRHTGFVPQPEIEKQLARLGLE